MCMIITLYLIHGNLIFLIPILYIAVKKMVQLLPKSEVDRDTALKLGKDLGLSEVHQDMNDISSIFLKWIEEKKEYCTPNEMVKVLVLTKGLGQYVSKIACKFSRLMKKKLFTHGHF